MQPITYQIYGRKAYATPLTFVGALAIQPEAELHAEALKKFGAEGWVELIALPTTDLLMIIPRTGAA
jgi:hypothetical protein